MTPRLFARLLPLAVAVAAVTARLGFFWVALTLTCLQDAGGADCLTPGTLALAPILSSTAGLLLFLRARGRPDRRTRSAVAAAVLLVLPLLWLVAPMLLNAL